MPIFEYVCQDCARAFETFVTGDRKPACPSCQSANLSKLLSRPGMVGTGDRSEPAGRPAQGCGTACGCRPHVH
jgi:putative FmdB family regulatory protein